MPTRTDSPAAPAQHLLLLEQDPVQAWWLAEMLTEAGFRVTPTASPERALAHCREEIFDLCIVNYRSRNHDRLPFLRQLYRRHLLPSLVVTGSRLERVLPQLPWYVRSALPKPYTRTQLTREVRRCLTHSESPA